MQQSNAQHNLNFIFSSPMSSSFVHPQPTAFPPTQPDDPNSPVLFKHNINLVQTQISTVRSVAHEALNAMCVIHSPRLNDELSGALPPANRRYAYSAEAPINPVRAPYMQLVSVLFLRFPISSHYSSAIQRALLR